MSTPTKVEKVHDKESFIRKIESMSQYTGKYDFTETIYLGADKGMTIRCKNHGYFNTTPNHMYDYTTSCSECKIDMKIEERIKKANAIYNYTIDYTNSRCEIVHVNVNFRCITHNTVFKQSWYRHLNGRVGCPKCKKVKKKRVVLNLMNEKQDMFNQIDMKYLKEQYPELDPASLRTNSKLEVQWICPVDGYIWIDTIKSRCYGGKNKDGSDYGKGCPRCSGKIIDETNSLAGLYPDVAEEFDFDKNAQQFPGKTPENISAVSCERYWWNCGRHESWIAQVYRRTTEGGKCSKCTKWRASKDNCVETFYPDIVKYWSPKNESPPEKYTKKSSYNAWWLCCDCTHEWRRRIFQVDNDMKCPGCGDILRGQSEAALEWLDYVSKTDNIQIQHMRNGGEYKIPGTRWRADGYCSTTNTIYEFNGTYYHADPRVYNPNDIFPPNHNSGRIETFGDRYQRTLEREKEIRRLGFNLVVMWEYDWNKMKKK